MQPPGQLTMQTFSWVCKLHNMASTESYKCPHVLLPQWLAISPDPSPLTRGGTVFLPVTPSTHSISILSSPSQTPWVWHKPCVCTHQYSCFPPGQAPPPSTGARGFGGGEGAHAGGKGRKERRKKSILGFGIARCIPLFKSYQP